MILTNLYINSKILKLCELLKIVPVTVRHYQSSGIYGYKPRSANEDQLTEKTIAARCNQSNFFRIVEAYRTHGHKIANVNPVAFGNGIESKKRYSSELDPKFYNLNIDTQLNYDGILHSLRSGTIKEALDYLQRAYTFGISAEFMYAETLTEREWFAEEMEKAPTILLDNETKKQIGVEMLKSQAFDHFLAAKFPGVKRYGGEGAEAMMAFFVELFKLAASDQMSDIIIAMPHRGRLNLLTGMLNYEPVRMFRKLKGEPDFPDSLQATGDVLSHVISSTNLKMNGHSVHISMLYNPSHLEAVNPVSMGKARAKHLHRPGSTAYQNGNFGEHILNVQVHGDAAFSGQGINQETLSLSRAPHFEIGGSIHLIVNNQLGFTTPSTRGRSSMYCSDLAKMILAPVLHVNGDEPEEVLKATRIAFKYQRKFRKDVFIDMNCYRQWGHNELDDPTFTNPALYKLITNKPTVPNTYANKLIEENVFLTDDIRKVSSSHNEWLNEQLKMVETYQPESPCFDQQWKDFQQAQPSVTTWDTGISQNLQTYIGIRSVTYPETFNIHPNLERNFIMARKRKLESGDKLDWATAEAIAMGSLLYQGYNVRISGQDVGRGTFSQRHCMLIDQESNNMFIPLNHIDPGQTGHLEVANSILSEEAVLGFEYGMSVENPQDLIIWEAQFGDFFNGAQIIFDTFISSGESKWLWSSGLTILLPHGYDGAGPEHSSSRIERFLQLTNSNEDAPDGDNINLQICQPSTPAQYFHLLRRQMIRNFRKPLIVITPKTLLRLSSCTSSYDEMREGSSFKPVISDVAINPKSVKKIIFCSGKHYYTLAEKLKETGMKSDSALVRIESFTPFPTMELLEEISRYPAAKKCIWAQEEPRNMGAWSFIKPRFENLLGRHVQYAGRNVLPAPAVGVGKWHQEQVHYIASKPFEL